MGPWRESDLWPRRLLPQLWKFRGRRAWRMAGAVEVWTLYRA
jgi:hypothetical protein